MTAIDASVWIAPGAQIYGDVSIGEGSSVWANAVIRCECTSVVIGRVSNIQDFVMIHVGYDHSSCIGDFCSIAHHTTIHGATVGDHCLVGINATLMDGAVIGSGSIVAGNAMVREGAVFPPGSIVAGVPAKLVAERDCSRENRLNAWLYHRNACAYRHGEHRAWSGAEFEAWKARMREEVAADRDLLAAISHLWPQA